MDPTYKGLSAPTPHSNRPKTGVNWQRALLVAVGLIGGIMIIGLLVDVLSPKSTNITQRLLYRFDALTTLTNSARPNIKDNNLSKVNADLSLMLNGDNTAIKKVTPVVKMDAELTAIKKVETDATTTDKLKTALVNGSFDTAYKKVLIQKLEATSSLITEVSSKTSSSTLKKALATAYDHMNTYYIQIKKLP